MTYRLRVAAVPVMVNRDSTASASASFGDAEDRGSARKPWSALVEAERVGPERRARTEAPICCTLQVTLSPQRVFPQPAWSSTSPMVACLPVLTDAKGMNKGRTACHEGASGDDHVYGTNRIR